MPSDVPPDAERALAKRCEKMGVKELAVPLGDGWMQRAGRGTFSVSAKVEGGGGGSEAAGVSSERSSVDSGNKAGGSNAPVLDIESLEPNFYLLTYDQTPDAHVTRSGHYRLECSMRAMPGHTVREVPYAAIALNWQRGRSTITAPCFLAFALTPQAWRVEQYCDGKQHTLFECRDSSLKAGGAFQKVVIEVRGDRIAVSVGKRPLLEQLIPPVVSAKGQGPPRSASPLTGSVGLAVFKSRAQVKKFELTQLEEAADGSGGVSGATNGVSSGGGLLVPLRPPFTGGDPKLVELIEGEMLDTSPRVEWDAIGGLADAKRLLNEAVVLPLLIPDYFSAAACRSTWKGVLLFGPPGTGKTLLARAVASLGKTAFFNISASSLVSKFHGESEKLCRTLFALARHYAPSVIFFDEVDALVSSRGMAGEHEASRRLKSELLTQMDGVNSGGHGAPESQVMVLATSNKPWDLDDAMRRRLERRIYVPLPDEASRREMLAIHLKGVALAADVKADELAQLTNGYSGADLQLACRDASMAPMRRMVDGKSPVEIVELQARGELEGEVTEADFMAALARTQPSTNAAELTQYAAFNDEFGCK